MQNPIAWRMYDWLAVQSAPVSPDLIAFELRLEQATAARFIVHMVRWGIAFLDGLGNVALSSAQEGVAPDWQRTDIMVDVFGDRPPMRTEPTLRPSSIWAVADACRSD